MANDELRCFQNLASEFLQDEINLSEEAKALAGTVAISTDLVKADSVTKLLGKPARGEFKSIQEHLSDLEDVTTNFSQGVGSLVENSLGDIINAFGKFPNEIIDTIESSFLSTLSVLSSNKSAAYGMSKNAMRRASSRANKRIETSNEIINLINNIRSVRSVIIPQSGSFLVDPRDAAQTSVDKLTTAKGIVQIVSASLSSNPLDRKLFTYDRALERMSEAIDALKIGASNFKIHEFLKLKAELTVAIEEFEEFDLEIDTAKQNFQRIESDYEDGKSKIGEVENNYLTGLLDRLTNLIDNMNSVIERDSEELAVDQLLTWSQEAVNVYALAHQVFDQEISEAIADASNEDKQKYDSTKVVVDATQTKAEDTFLADLKSLPDLYLGFLFGKFLEADLVNREESVKDQLVTISQEDQKLVDANSGFNPTELIILGTMLTFADRAGLDKVADAILTGDLGGLLGNLTASFGSKASNAAECLSSGIGLVEDLETRQFLQNVNATVQAIHKNRQLAGSTRENAFKRAGENIDQRIRDLSSQKNRLENLDL